MSDPAFYPHGPERVELVETHISWVFLAGELVYKVKKPIVFPFLDYGTLERRRAMCEEEVRLGRRLAPVLYLGVRQIVGGPGRWALGEPGAEGACEYAVELRRFAEERTLASLLQRGKAGPREIRDVAKRLARFHAETQLAPAGSFPPSAIAAAVSGNFATLLDFPSAVEGRVVEAGQRFAVAFVHANRELFQHRAAHGRVRDCHGDLRAEHVILNGEVQVFDAVEFDPGLRLIDVSADLAFLVMDLERADRPDLAAELLAGYRREGGDPGPDALVYFYAAYRAWVRAKVAVLRANELAPDDPAQRASLDEGRGLAAHGRRLAWRARRPLTLVVCGVSATGKTRLARELALLSGLAHLNSDVVRKELAGLPPEDRAGPEHYSEEFSLATYRELGSRAASALAAHGGAIVDATFRRRAGRDAFAEGFGAKAPAPLFVECRAPASVLAARATRREAEPAHVSDASPAIVERQRHEFEPLDEVQAKTHLALRTDRTPDEVLDDLEAALDGRISGGAGVENH